MHSIMLADTATATVSPSTLLALVESGALHPMDALNQLVEGGVIELRTTEDELDLTRPAVLIADEVKPWNDRSWERGLADAMYGRRKVTPTKQAAQQVEYVGPLGRGKVTFGRGEAIVSRLKPNGAWKIVARHPWPETSECLVNRTLQGICGPEFYAKED